MKVGTKIEKKQIDYLKDAYANFKNFERLPESGERVKLTLEEYRRGEPDTFLD